MSNTLKVHDLIAAESAAILSNELVFTGKLDRAYESKFNLDVQDHRIGTSIRIPKPPKFTVRDGFTRQVQNFQEDSVTLTIDTPKGVDCDFTDSELSLLMIDPDKNMEAWSSKYLKPRVTQLANKVDLDLFAKAMVTVPNLVGTPGTTPANWGVLGDAMQKLDEALAPQDDRTLIVNPAARNKLNDGLKGSYSGKVGEKALLRGWIPLLADFDMFMSQSVPNQTVGAQGGTPLVNGSSQTGNTLITNGWTASVTAVLKQGDIITLAGVYQVNPVNKQQYTSLQQFNVQTANSDSSGNATLTIYPSIITSGATQTVSNSPANNTAITVIGSASTAYAQNLAFHKKAFTCAFAKLIVPTGVDKASQKTFGDITVRYVRDWNNTNAVMEDRLDVYYGFKEIYPEWGVRVTG